MAVRVRRVYAESERADGYRVLVDRLWPRGVSKGSGAFDAWLKDLAPSSVLRKRFHGEELTFARFGAAYRKELGALDSEQLDDVLERLRAGEAVTLLYAAKDEERNHAHVLREWLESRV